MPSRRRPKSPTNTSPAARPVSTSSASAPSAGGQSDVERFAAALKDAEKAERAEKARQLQERNAAAQRAEEAAAHATALATARRDLERAVEGVRTAKQVGRGRAEADQAWKVAKATVIELETGTAPAWAPKPPERPEIAQPEETDAADEAGETVASGDAEDDIQP